jgi:Mycobacterium membrane protein
MFRLLRKLWIPLVVLIVVGAGGLAVSRLHGVFGSENSLAYGDTASDEGTPVDPKIMRYEIFGPPGTVAQISYFNEKGDPQFLEAVPLPWTLEFPITGAAGIGSIAAQGDSDSIGCRILVDGVVKDEKIESHEASTFTACILKAA